MYAKIGLSIRPYQRKMFPGDYHNCNDHNINETKYYNFSLNLSNFTPGVALQFLVSYTACFFISSKLFVHLTNFKSFYRGLKYPKTFICLLDFIKNCQKYIFHISSFFQGKCIYNFTLNTVNMTGSYMTLHNLMALCFKP